MNHPQNEQWLLYLDGELPPEERRRLKGHLEQCGQCAAQIEGWQRTVAKLRSLAPPEPAPLRLTWNRLKWAAAAALMIGLGFGWGRFTAHPPAEIQRMAQELKEQLGQKFRANLLDALHQEQQQAGQELLRTLARDRAEDRRATLALFDQLQQQQTADILALRLDLETLASMTDDRLQQTQWDLSRLAVDTSLSQTQPENQTPNEMIP